MTTEDRMAALTRDLRRMKIAPAVVVAGTGTMTLTGAIGPASDAQFGAITAERINIAEPDGTFRAVLTSGARSPGPMLRAREGAKEGQRNFPIGGMILCDRDGQEQGGYGTGSFPAQGSMGVTTLDWPGSDSGGFGGAISSFRRVDANGKASSGINLVD